jgi:hypothetical protein
VTALVVTTEAPVIVMVVAATEDIVTEDTVITEDMETPG